MSLIHLGFFILLCAIIHGFPHNGILKDFEASGGHADDPVRGTVKVFKLNSRVFQQPGFGLRSGTAPRSPFPAFLALGRPGPAQHGEGAPHKRLEADEGLEVRRRQGLDMWQKAMEKSSQTMEVLPLPGNLKDASRQSCTAVPFMQRVSEPGCDPVSVSNKLCFGHCSSLFVPPGSGPRGSSCSRCAPARARYTTVTLRCRNTAHARQKHVMLVEECRCETGREEERAPGVSMPLVAR
ncbi:hypothetical protein GN956_G8233 [Arapaima gigas]